jgi:hypothetical protein
MTSAGGHTKLTERSQPIERPRRWRYGVTIWIGLKWLRRDRVQSPGSVFLECQF